MTRPVFGCRDEYDFVAVPSSLQRESAVWVVGHKLAIESGAVKSLYLYAYGLIRSWRSTKVQRSEAGTAQFGLRLWLYFKQGKCAIAMTMLNLLRLGVTTSAGEMQ